MKKVILLIAVLTISTSLFSQKIRYRDVKNKYSVSGYNRKMPKKEYSPLAAGLLSFYIPGLGQAYAGEPLRGLAFFGAQSITSIGLITGFLLTLQVDPTTGKSPYIARPITYAAMASGIILNVYNIYDAVHVAKIKNMAYADKKNTVSLNLSPAIFSMQNKNLAGIGLTLTF